MIGQLLPCLLDYSAFVLRGNGEIANQKLLQNNAWIFAEYWSMDLKFHMFGMVWV